VVGAQVAAMVRGGFKVGKCRFQVGKLRSTKAASADAYTHDEAHSHLRARPHKPLERLQFLLPNAGWVRVKVQDGRPGSGRGPW